MNHDEIKEQQDIAVVAAQKSWADRVVNGWVKLFADHRRRNPQPDEVRKDKSE